MLLIPFSHCYRKKRLANWQKQALGTASHRKTPEFAFFLHAHNILCVHHNALRSRDGNDFDVRNASQRADRDDGNAYAVDLLYF